MHAVPAPAAVAVQGDVEPTIVWYDSATIERSQYGCVIAYSRAWSDGTIEVRLRSFYDGTAPGNDFCSLGDLGFCGGWIVISSPNEGLNAAADINFDEVVNGADLASLLAKWGDAPRNPMPPSDCPLGLLN